MKRFFVIGFWAAIIVSLAGCGIDYSKVESWAVFPEAIEHEVDVFFIAPSSGTDKDFNMKMEDEKYKKAFIGATLMEKGIYDTKADFYAPFYRQASLDAYSLKESEREKFLQSAYKDVKASFHYYMKHLNHSRPYILAGFSQGSDMLKRLLKDYTPDERLIATYAIGWNFTQEDKGHIKMAQGERDLGVVISFCSESPEYNGTNLICPKGTIGINPLNWKTDSTAASKEENLGACFTDYSGTIQKEFPSLSGAYLDKERGTLKVTGLEEPYPSILNFLEEGNYHIYDYLFFYRNLQHNVEERIEAKLQKK